MNKEVKKSKNRTIRFIKSTAKNGKLEVKILFTWSDIVEDDIPIICQNYIDGIMFSISEFDGNGRFSKPINMYLDGYSFWTKYFQEGHGVRYSFVGEDGKLIKGNIK